MNFFEHQEIARVKSTRLLMLFAAGVIAMCFSVYIVARFVKEWFFGSYKQELVHYTNSFGEAQSYFKNVKVPFEFWDTQLFVYTAGPTLLIILMGMIYRIYELNRGGGDAVATLMGGVLVRHDTENPQQRMLLNVVEEMAIASGLPVPRVYMLPNEYSINAFAAGTEPTNSIIAVTSGALEQFNRDELQGVVAHEFSHIFNGDVLLNIRLMGAISGILMIATIGRILLRTSSRSRNKKSGPLPIVGLGLLIVGYLGVFFGRLIKSAVSREREYLADASAVQYTRNPFGIASALYKISEQESLGIRSVHAEETSHMFFESSIRHFFSWMSTHPPLRERIHRVSPQFMSEAQIDTLRGKRRSSFKSDLNSNLSTQVSPPAVEKLVSVVIPEEITKNFGVLNLNGLALASFLLESTPQKVIESIHTSDGALKVLLYLLLSTDKKLKQLGKELIEAELGKATLIAIEQLEKDLETLSVDKKLMALEIIQSSLRTYEKSEVLKLHSLSTRLIELDKNVSVFEFCIQIVIDKLLEKKKIYTPTVGLNLMSVDIIKVLYSIGLSDQKRDDVDQAVEKAVQYLAQSSKVNLMNDLKTYKEEAAIRALSLDLIRSLKRLNRLRPKDKEELLKACAIVASNNGKVEPEELFQIKALSIAIETPLGLGR